MARVALKLLIPSAASEQRWRSNEIGCGMHSHKLRRRSQFFMGIPINLHS